MRAFTRNISFCRSVAVSTVFGVNCAVLDTYDTRAGITYSGAASSTIRTSAPSGTRPTTVSGRKNVM